MTVREGLLFLLWGSRPEDGTYVSFRMRQRQYLLQIKAHSGWIECLLQTV